MRIPFQTLQSRWSALLAPSHAFLAAGLVAVGITATNLIPTVALSAEVKQTKPAEAAKRLPDGVYLYGQSEEPDQIGKGYFVFEVTQGKVIGALYMPRSSFDCASGRFEADQLALTVVNSYDRLTNPFEIALEQTSSIATSGNPTLPAIGLQGFNRLTTVTENDRRMLNVCKADLQPQQAQNWLKLHWHP